MRIFNKEDIEKMRDLAESNGFEKARASVDGHSFEYYVLPSNVNPELKNFVWRVTGKPEDGYVLGISEDVKEEFRPYSVFHELYEFNTLGIQNPDRCSLASHKELLEVPSLIANEYSEMRSKFFRDLRGFALKNPREFTREDLKHFLKSKAIFDGFLNG